MLKHSNAPKHRYEIVCGGSNTSKIVPCDSQAAFDGIASQLAAGHSVSTAVGMLTPGDMPLLLRKTARPGQKMTSASPAVRKVKAELPPPLPMEIPTNGGSDE